MLDEAGNTVAEKKLLEKTNHLKRWNAKPLILTEKYNRKAELAGHSAIALSGDVDGSGTSVSHVSDGE